MKTYYITLGQTHRHILPNGSVWDKDGVVRVLAPNRDEARSYICNLFGFKWSVIYEADEMVLAFYPKGIVWTYDLGGGSE